jgi:hypothetical protein
VSLREWAKIQEVLPPVASSVRNGGREVAHAIMSTHAMSLPRPMRRGHPPALPALVCGLWLWPVSPVVAVQPVQLVHLAEGRLSVAAHDAVLRTLVEDVSRETGLHLEGEERLRGEVTVRFRRRTLDDGLALILAGWRYTLTPEVLAASDDGEGATPARLRVLGPRRMPVPTADVDQPARPKRVALGRVDAPVDSNDLAIVRRAGLAALRDPDRGVRATAVKALAARGGDDAVSLLELALRDSDLGIRLDAIEALRTIGGDRAARGLTAAVHDRSRRLRLRAVDALGAIGGPTARQLLDYVQAVDRDRTVRTVAVQELANLRAGH